MDPQESIIQTYQNFLPQLSATKQQHFLSRLYKLTGDTSLLGGIQDKAFHEFYDKLKKFLETSTVEIDFEVRFSLNSPIERQRVRNSFIHSKIEEFSETFVYLDVLMAFNVIHRYHQEHRIETSDYRLIQDYLDSGFYHYFDRFLSSEDYLLNTPVQVINILYWYKHLPQSILKGGEEDRLNSTIKKSFSEDKLKDITLFLNYLYTLTHVIIGASWFYEYKVDAPHYDWIFESFLENQQLIFDTQEPDIIAEIGVCFCLQRSQNLRTISTYQREIITYFDNNHNYIPTGAFEIGSNEDLNLAEHRNILAIMLLSGLEHLYQFPLKTSL
jgi:hypothetical protein